MLKLKLNILATWCKAPTHWERPCCWERLKEGGLGGKQEIVVAQSLSHVQLFAIPWTAACQAFLSFIVSQSLLKFMSIESVMLSIYLILCHPLLLLPSTFPSIRVFFYELALCIRWQKYWSFSICPSNEYSGLISFFRIYWFDLLAVQGALKSLLQHHNLKASILWRLACFKACDYI